MESGRKEIGAVIHGKSWFAILRMYGPEKEWLDGEYFPGEITLVE